MYVNYYDRYERIEGESPTIGILLCKKSDEALVDLTLPEEILQRKLKEWLDEEQDKNRNFYGGICNV